VTILLLRVAEIKKNPYQELLEKNARKKFRKLTAQEQTGMTLRTEGDINILW